jgi:hypothetical protein
LPTSSEFVESAAPPTDAVRGSSRSRPGREAQHWDTAAGRIAQHQAAVDIEHGIGPHQSLGGRGAFAESYRAIEADIAHVEHGATPEREVGRSTTSLGVEL